MPTIETRHKWTETLHRLYYHKWRKETQPTLTTHLSITGRYTPVWPPVLTITGKYTPVHSSVSLKYEQWKESRDENRKVTCTLLPLVKEGRTTNTQQSAFKNRTCAFVCLWNTNNTDMILKEGKVTSTRQYHEWRKKMQPTVTSHRLALSNVPIWYFLFLCYFIFLVWIFFLFLF